MYSPKSRYVVLVIAALLLLIVIALFIIAENYTAANHKASPAPTPTYTPVIPYEHTVPPRVKDIPTLIPEKGGGLDINSPVMQNSIEELQKLDPYLPFAEDITLSTGVRVSILIPEKNLQITPWTLTAGVYGINYDTSPGQADYVTTKESFKEAAKIIFAWIRSHNADPEKILFTWGTRAYIQDQAEAWLSSAN